MLRSLWLALALVAIAGTACWRGGPKTTVTPQQALAPALHFTALKKTLAGLESASIIGWAKGAKKGDLTKQELEGLRRIIKNCRLGEGISMTPPPWDALMELRTAKHIWPIQLTASGLRMDPAHPYSPKPAPPAVECVPNLLSP